MDEVEQKFIKLIDKIKDKLSAKDTTIILNDTEHGEIEIAYELLCVQLYEYSISISREIYEEIYEIGKILKIDASYYTVLEKLIN